MGAEITRRLEDFGVRETLGPQERLREYQEQAKDMRQSLRARFWLGVLERDPEVKALVSERNPHKRRMRGLRRRGR